MKPSQVDHIGIAVTNLENAISFYEKVLGLTCYNIEEVADQRVKTAFFMAGQTKLELLESTDPDSSVGKFIKNKGEGIHHIAFSVENIEEQLACAEKLGVKLIDTIPRKGGEGFDVAFLHPRSTYGVLIEFCENKKGQSSKNQ